MKKFLAVLLVALCGAASLFADDVADVKSVFLKECEFAATGDFIATLSLRTPDFVEVNEFGTFDYAQTKWMLLALDGKHPEEFALMLMATETRGRKFSPEMLDLIREKGRDPEFVRRYEMAITDLTAKLKADARHEFKTLKFKSVKVDGDSAVAVIEYDSLITGHRVSVVRLRRENGVWRFCRIGGKPVGDN